MPGRRPEGPRAEEVGGRDPAAGIKENEEGRGRSQKAGSFPENGIIQPAEGEDREVTC